MFQKYLRLTCSNKKKINRLLSNEKLHPNQKLKQGRENNSSSDNQCQKTASNSYVSMCSCPCKSLTQFLWNCISVFRHPVSEDCIELVRVHVFVSLHVAQLVSVELHQCLQTSSVRRLHRTRTWPCVCVRAFRIVSFRGTVSVFG